MYSNNWFSNSPLFDTRDSMFNSTPNIKRTERSTDCLQVKQLLGDHSRTIDEGYASSLASSTRSSGFEQGSAVERTPITDVRMMSGIQTPSQPVNRFIIDQAKPLFASPRDNLDLSLGSMSSFNQRLSSNYTPSLDNFAQNQHTNYYDYYSQLGRMAMRQRFSQMTNENADPSKLNTQVCQRVLEEMQLEMMGLIDRGISRFNQLADQLTRASVESEARERLMRSRVDNLLPRESAFRNPLSSRNERTPLTRSDSQVKASHENVVKRLSSQHDRVLGRRLRRSRIKPSASVNKSDQSGEAISDGTLDLRVKRASESSPDSSPSKRIQMKFRKQIVLTAVHLKRAKLMFIFARYPNSALLKTCFPEVSFTRSTTAQIVKWFSNFREFFYLQIERYVRRCYTSQVDLTEEMASNEANSHLLEIMDQHYNRGKEIKIPAEFVSVIHLVVQKMFHAIKNNFDSEPSWKKEIYKSVAFLDAPFPDFIQSIN